MKLRFGLWLLVYAMALLALVVFARHLIGPAEAHHWYTNQRNVKGSSCCSGTDCAPVPISADWVQPSRDGYRVTLTLEQARTINPDSQFPMDVTVPWAHVMAPPPEAARDSIPALYHLCIAAGVPNLVYCLFAVPGL